MPRKSVAPERREQIVQALFQCLAEKGHESVTVKDIAKKAGLHYGVIHYYFKSKDDIVTAMSEFIVSRYGQLLSNEIDSAGTATDRLRAALDFLVDEFIFNPGLNRVFYNLVQMAFENETIRVALREQLRIYRRLIEETVQAGIESGEFEGNASETARLMVALVEGTALQWTIEPKVLDRDEVHASILKTIEGLLTGR
jgi:AcrR family transcriptional regulator